jgi:antitoxin ParD1/3/4
MPTRNVVLTERLEELLNTLVKSGRYQNASEVLRDGLRLVEKREAEDAGKLKALRAAARAGVGPWIGESSRNSGVSRNCKPI